MRAHAPGEMNPPATAGCRTGAVDVIFVSNDVDRNGDE